MSRHCHAVFALEPLRRRWTCSTPVLLSITLARQLALNNYLPILHLEWSFFVWRRHPSDSNLHVGVIINGLHRLWVCSACSLLPCVHSKHQFNVLQKFNLHTAFPSTSCVCSMNAVKHKATLWLDFTNAGTVRVSSSSSCAHLLVLHDDWISRWASYWHSTGMSAEHSRATHSHSLIPFSLVIFRHHVQTWVRTPERK